MGQVGSRAATADEAAAAIREPQSRGVQSSYSTPAANNNRSQSSLDSLIAEAAAFGEDENESLEAKAQKALECPCIAHLRTGSCGLQFSDAFLCFLKSTAEEKGSDCMHPFVALQACIKTNPDAFAKDVLEKEEINNKEKPTQEHNISPPLWSLESRKSKKSTEPVTS